MNYDTLISFAIATSALAISPGPDNIYVLIQSITNGKIYGLVTVCGLITGCIVHTTLLAFGISAIIKANDDLFFGIDDTNLMLMLELLIQVRTQCFLTAPDIYKGKLVEISHKRGEIELYTLDNKQIVKAS